jgi:Na+-driven multidrug efflux pump
VSSFAERMRVRFGVLCALQAQLSAWICLATSTLLMLLLGLLIVPLRRELGAVFTSDPAVIEVVAKLCPMVALYQVGLRMTFYQLLHTQV